jgi:ligand-binding SRPBCC domain-containing protein
MRKFRHSFVVDAEIERLWKFYTNMKHLEVISPPSLELVIVKTTHQELEAGSEVWLAGKLITRSNWHSRITSLSRYEYVDEMITGRFRVWKHVHRFHNLGERKTEVIDEIDFELHYGLTGRLFEGYVARRLENVFAHRKAATISAFNGAK